MSHSKNKNPWRLNDNLAFGSLEQFSDEVGISSQNSGEYHYPFIERMRAADEAASKQRQQRQQEGFRVLQETPASQFASSSHVPHLLSLVQSMQSYYDKYNNHSFLRHLE